MKLYQIEAQIVRSAGKGLSCFCVPTFYLSTEKSGITSAEDAKLVAHSMIAGIAQYNPAIEAINITASERQSTEEGAWEL